jgi:hypothetical protein
MSSERIVAVFGASASRPGDGHYEDGERCGRLLTEAGFGVVTGGYGGLMEAVSKGASAAGGHVLGVTVPSLFPERATGNEFLTEEWRAAHLMERIHELTEVSVASITLHGSIGTLVELAVAWNLAFVGKRAGQDPKPIITVGERWASLVPALAEALETDESLVTVVDTVEEAVGVVEQRCRD